MPNSQSSGQRFPIKEGSALSSRYTNSLTHFSETVETQDESFIGFVRDPESAGILRSSLASVLGDQAQIYVMELRVALDMLAQMPTPSTVLIDLSGEEQPLNALMQLSEVVDMGTNVIAIGENHTLNFYRGVVKNMGVREYLAKPLTKDTITQYLLPVLTAPKAEGGGRGGRMVTLCGARGGVGTSYITANLGWYIANEMHSHTVLLDGDLNTGTLALYLNAPVSRGLSSVLSVPDRVDQLLIERCVHDLGGRLHLVAGMEDLNQPFSCDPQAISNFLNVVKSRYNVVVADAGARLGLLPQSLLRQSQQGVIVMDPTLISLRMTVKLLNFMGNAGMEGAQFIVLNKSGLTGGLTRQFIEGKLRRPVDAEISDMPRLVNRRVDQGELMVRQRGPFREAIIALAQALERSAVQNLIVTNELSMA